jgi:hypothetical protein
MGEGDGTEKSSEAEWPRAVMVRAAVDPLRCAIRASRKPGVAIPGHPFDVYVSPLEAAGNAFCAFAILRRPESRWFADPWQTPLVACDQPLRFTPRPMTLRVYLGPESANCAVFRNGASMPVPA